MSLVLTDAGEKLEITTTAVTIPFTVHYADYVGATPVFTPGVASGDTIVGTKDLLVAPGSGQRVVRTVTVHNDSGGSDTITIQLDDGGVNYTIVKVILADDHTLSYDEDGWRVLDDTGSILTILVGNVIQHNILSPSHADAVTDAVSQGSIIVGNATPAWDELVHPGAAGYALVSGAATLAWDQTPAWTGRHSFAAGITFNGGAGANSVVIPDALADAFDIADAGGTEFLRLDTVSDYFLIDPGAVGIKVGIGTATPAHNLEISHTAAGVKIIGSTHATMWLKDTGAPVNQKQFLFRTESGLSTMRALNDADAAYTFDFLAFDHSNGNVGIGTAGPLARLEVNGDSSDDPLSILDSLSDDDAAFINFKGATASSKTKSIYTGVTYSYSGMVRVQINGVDHWMPYFS